MRSTSVLFFVIGTILLFGLAKMTAGWTFRTPLRMTSAASGEEMFAVYCSSCHGRFAQGGSGPDLTSLAKRNKGQFPAAMVKEIIRGEGRVPAHGPKDMPAWGLVFRYIGSGTQLEVDFRINNLTDYISSLQEK
jgi:mono/diheme cytochrome c family protein